MPACRQLPPRQTIYPSSYNFLYKYSFLWKYKWESIKELKTKIYCDCCFYIFYFLLLHYTHTHTLSLCFPILLPFLVLVSILCLLLIHPNIHPHPLSHQPSEVNTITPSAVAHLQCILSIESIPAAQHP